MAITNAMIPRRLCTNEADVLGSNEQDEYNDNQIRLSSISDPLFMHFSRTFTIHELLQLKQVCKSFASLISKYTHITAKARKEGNIIDWYFPLLRVKNRWQLDEFDSDRQVKFINLLTWSGLHRSSREAHRLPSLAHLSLDHLAEHFPSLAHLVQRFPSLAQIAFHFPDLGLLASSKGLILLTQPFTSVYRDWRPLLVSNPVTKEWTLLPAPPSAYKSFDYEGFRAHVWVDETANAYKVIVTFREVLGVYHSTSKQWSFSNVDPLPWGIRRASVHMARLQTTSPYVEAASALVGGRLHFAELEYGGNPQPRFMEHPLTLGQVRVYEVDDEAGTWKAGVCYSLRNHIPSRLHAMREYDLGLLAGSFSIGLVECMGSMYAIIPSCLKTFSTVPEDLRGLLEEELRLGPASAPQRYSDYGFLPIRFYVLKLQGTTGRAFGQIMVQSPLQEYSSRSSRMRMDLLWKLHDNPHNRISRWYHRVARGSVIG